MMTDEPEVDEVSDVDIEPVPSKEYERAAAATATVEGPAGRIRLQRRYEALPRHNDVIAPDRVDANDELLDRPDAVHVHTRHFAVDGGAEFVLDTHETWIPDAVGVLGDPTAFLEVCRDHHVTGLSRAYRRAAADRSGGGERGRHDPA